MQFDTLIKSSSEQRITGMITSRLSPGWWIVTDDQGRTYRAAGSGNLQINDNVAMLGNQIVDGAGVRGFAKIYEV